MNLEQAIKNIDRSVRKRKPECFNVSWVRHKLAKSYAYIEKHVTTETGEIDWDEVVRRLEYEHQKMWLKGVKRKKKVETYEDMDEVEAILSRYRERLYTFMVQTDKEDKKICDVISIRLVRTAQKGNMLAQEKAMGLIRQLVEQWMEDRGLGHWRGYGEFIDTNIERCIRRYRYSGSFTTYLYRTLQYAGRGIRPLEVFSLDSYSQITGRRRSENVVQNEETNEIYLY